MNENDIRELKLKIENEIEGYRYIHTISVYNECTFLANKFALSIDDSLSLRSAALLHDITKKYNFESQLKLSEELGVRLSEDDVLSPSVLHSLTAAAYAEKNYSSYVNSKVISAIGCHTTGKPDMSIIDKLLYLCDYIEPTRNYESCKNLRSYFYDGLDKENLNDHLNETLIRSFDDTIVHLIDKNAYIHPLTISSRNFLIKNRSNNNRTEK